MGRNAQVALKLDATKACDIDLEPVCVDERVFRWELNQVNPPPPNLHLPSPHVTCIRTLPTYIRSHRSINVRFCLGRRMLVQPGKAYLSTSFSFVAYQLTFYSFCNALQLRRV